MMTFDTCWQWEENYGNSKIDIVGGLRNAIGALQLDTRIPLLGYVVYQYDAMI